MKKSMLALALVAAAVAVAAPAAAQDVVAVRPMAGTRLDLSATGTVSRVPDLAIISAGVVTKSTTATGAIADNAARMERVRAALKRAGLCLGLCLGLADAERFQRRPRRAGDVRAEPDRLAKVGDGVLTVALHAVGDATVVVREGEARVEADGFAVVGNGANEIAFFTI